MGVELNGRKDEFIWSLNKRFFSVNSMYKDLMRENAIPDFYVSWKLKLPLKIKVFLWYLKKVILTKDELVKRNWKGCTKCCFCSREETIQHLFFDCHMSRFIWNSLFLSFGITPPSSVANLFGSWYESFPLTYGKTIMIGTSALCWAIWLRRNDVIFKNSITNSVF